MRSIFKILNENEDTIKERGSLEKDSIYGRGHSTWGFKYFYTHPMLKSKGVGSRIDVLKVLVEFKFTGEDIVCGSGAIDIVEMKLDQQTNYPRILNHCLNQENIRIVKYSVMKKCFTVTK